MSAAIWLPFFKAADAQALKEEREAQEASSEAVATQAA
jgi:cellobiose-specific phosphotransferase system component IIC